MICRPCDLLSGKSGVLKGINFLVLARIKASNRADKLKHWVQIKLNRQLPKNEYPYSKMKLLYKSC